MRLLLFTGKGGVGKTTVAAATAVHAAHSGVKTLVVSTDAAHSLGDALGLRLGERPVEVEPGLAAFHVDPRSRSRRSWDVLQEYVLGLLDGLGVDPVVGEELTTLPGVEEVLALLEIRDAVTEGSWDLVVVDCAPTADTLRLLALPEAFSRYVERALPIQRRVMRALARPTQRDLLVEAAERLHAELAAVRDVLVAPTTTVRLVLTPESVVVAEARRAWTTLALFGYVVDGVVANRLVPGGDDPWRAAWAAAQASMVAELEASFAPVPVQRVPYEMVEPVGVSALAAFGEQLYGPAGDAGAQALLEAPPSGEALSVRRDGEQFVLGLPLPLATREEIDLTRVDDDLVVAVAGYRRVVTLPSALRRCTVRGARLHDGQLDVRFEPDPALWRPL